MSPPQRAAVAALSLRLEGNLGWRSGGTRLGTGFDVESGNTLLHRLEPQCQAVGWEPSTTW